VWYVEFRVTDILIQSVSPDNWRLSSVLTHSVCVPRSSLKQALTSESQDAAT
jgi:hypothetical protein